MENVPMKKARPALIAAAPGLGEVDLELPEEYLEWDRLSSLPPTVSWNEPGDYVSGVFVGVQEHVGPNDSLLYNLMLMDGSVVCVWGTTVLDAALKFIGGGDSVMIQYIGDLPPKAGQNPAKNFRVLVAPNSRHKV